MIRFLMSDVGVTDVVEPPAEDAGTRTEVVGSDKLINLLQQRAQAAVDAGSRVETLVVRIPTVSNLLRSTSPPALRQSCVGVERMMLSVVLHAACEGI